MLRNERKGLCLVVSAPSGAGKSTIVKEVLARDPGIVLSVSVTTRAPRAGELDGREYHFRRPNAFAAMVTAGELLEHADVFGRGYGTPRGPVEAELEAGRDVILDIDWQGWRQMRASLPEDCVGVFILPPSMTQLEARLRGRASETEAEMQRRMRAARDEISHWAEFDYVLVNDALDTCVEAVMSIIRAERHSARRARGTARLAAEMMAEREAG